MTYNETEIWFEMPKDWKFEETHPDLFKLAEFVLLSPYEPPFLMIGSHREKQDYVLDWPFQQELIQQQQCA